MRQPLTGIPQSDAMPILLPVNPHRPAIAHHHMQRIPNPRRRCLHQTFVLAICNTVPDRILHDGLQQKARNQCRRSRAGSTSI